jgi:hypothetical protein
MIIAVTHFDEINMVICQIAHTLFSVPFKIARVRDQSYIDPAWKNIFSREGLPIDMVISPEVEVGEAILQRLRTPGAIMSATFGRGKVRLLGLEISLKTIPCWTRRSIRFVGCSRTCLPGSSVSGQVMRSRAEGQRRAEAGRQRLYCRARFPRRKADLDLQ